MGANRLEHGKRRPEQGPGAPTTSETSDYKMSRRQFFRLGAAGAVLVAGLAAGVPIGLMAPKTAKAQDVVIQGQTVRVVLLDKTLSELDRETERYRQGEYFDTVEMHGVTTTYSNAVIVPGVVTFMVSYGSTGKILDVTFPRERDENPSSPNAGARAFDLTEFANLVKNETGNEMERVKINLERGTFMQGIQQVDYVTAYLLPLNANGEPITRHGQGQYLVYECSYYSGRTFGGTSLVVEPNNQDTMARS